MYDQFSSPDATMRYALELAARGIGSVEPNPPVGAVVVSDEWRALGTGRHERFGGPHAEVQALRAAGGQAQGATLLVTLEPCCHEGKTPPCTRAIIDAGIRRVYVGCPDPAPHASGKGIAELRQAGLQVVTGVLAADAASLIAPFRKLMTTARPWVHAKWAMTLDGRIASRTGASEWISNEASRRIVHRLRGRMDAIVVGSTTALQDDPLLTARPPGPRTATRIVVDSRARLPLDSQLVQTADQIPVIVVTGNSVDGAHAKRLEKHRVEVLTCGRSGTGNTGAPSVALDALLDELGRRQMTNILVEGGGTLLGSLFDLHGVDEIHAFIAPRIVGGTDAVAPVGGRGHASIAEALRLQEHSVEVIDSDLYVHGFAETPTCHDLRAI